ncbi:MAG TPA: hypothetical protein VHC73_08895 [Vitreimonas sp.]|nr:hypothetical protein [Vitreimonas sp.]
MLILAIHPASNFAPTVAPLSVILEDLARAPEGDAALKQKAIMGGYGHARAAEWLLGGATFEMIELADIPILMSH